MLYKNNRKQTLNVLRVSMKSLEYLTDNEERQLDRSSLNLRLLVLLRKVKWRRVNSKYFTLQ